MTYVVIVLKGREIVIEMKNVKAPWSLEQITVPGMVSALLMTVADSQVQVK